MVNDSDDFLYNLSDIPGQSPYQADQKPLSFLDELHLYKTLLIKHAPPWNERAGEICSQKITKTQPWQHVWRRIGCISENKD
jgi:hypothetical protein